MNYIKVSQFDTSNGPGIRTVLWTAGCIHHCPGCHNHDTWNPTVGEKYTDEVSKFILSTLEPDYISGLTISGGDPLYFSSITPLSELTTIVKKHYPNKSIWLYTGYTYEAIQDEMRFSDPKLKILMSNIDVLVDGRYEADKRDITLPYCGSTNQRVIDVRNSVKENKIILYEY